jgi:hypothetical protein
MYEISYIKKYLKMMKKVHYLIVYYDIDKNVCRDLLLNCFFGENYGIQKKQLAEYAKP